MITPDVLLDRIRTRLDENERLARAVKPLGYTDVMGRGRVPETFSIARRRMAGEDEYPQRHADPAAKAHFRAHDPTAVLRQVEGYRRVLTRHEPVDAYPSGAVKCEYCASLCHSLSGLQCDNPDAPWPCDDIRDLAYSLNIDLGDELVQCSACEDSGGPCRACGGY